MCSFGADGVSRDGFSLVTSWPVAGLGRSKGTAGDMAPGLPAVPRPCGAPRVCCTNSRIGVARTGRPVACCTTATPGPSLTTTFCGLAAARVLVSRFTLLITVVWLRIVVLFTTTDDGRTGSVNCWERTKANWGAAMVTRNEGGGNGAQPMYPPPTRHET